MPLYLPFFILLLVTTSAYIQSDLQQSIQELYQKLNQKHYWTRDQNYVFPIKWEHKKGIYESKVHFNYVDHRNTYPAKVIRDQAKVDDINMFVTSFVLYGLLEAKQLGTIKIDEHIFSESIEAINDFRDKNTPEGIPQYSFWKQIDINGTWVAYATNLLNSINLLPTIPPYMANFLNKIGLGIFAQAKNIKKFFTIPPDMDDSSVNLALLAFMKETQSPHYEFWNSFNLKKQEFYDKALKYAYRPFGANQTLNPRADEIDARTYFVLHKFLERKKAESDNPSVILPTTWIISFDEQSQGKVVMPFKVNNVDATVAANFLFGLCYQLIMKEVVLNPDLEQMMLDTTDLLVFTVTEMLKERPTLILVYYPSKFDFYWFVSRIVHLLKRHPNSEDPLPQIRTKLEKLMKDVATPQIISSAKKDHQGDEYWAEFLGNYANKQRNQDSFFSTSLALNALLDTWTTRNHEQLTYDEDTPPSVKEQIQRGIGYLIKCVKQYLYYRRENRSSMNAFFSGSAKSFFTMPFFFPSNVNYDDKNPKINPNNATRDNIDFSIVSYLKGYIEKQEYEEMLKKKWYGFDVPKEYALNDFQGMGFPFWSSSAITEVMSITALSKVLKVSENDELYNLRNS